MKKTMKRVVTMLLVTALVVGLVQTTESTTAQAAGKYTLKVKNITTQVGAWRVDIFPETNKNWNDWNKSVKLKYKVISGKKIVKLKVFDDYAYIDAKKKGTAKIRVTAIYYKGYGNKIKKVGTVKKTCKVTVKKSIHVSKDDCEGITDRHIKLRLNGVHGWDYSESNTGSTNKVIQCNMETADDGIGLYYVIPVIKYKVLSGGEHVWVDTHKYGDGLSGNLADIMILARSEGTAEIEVTTTYKEYKSVRKGKDKLVNKAYVVVKGRLTVDVI